MMKTRHIVGLVAAFGAGYLSATLISSQRLPDAETAVQMQAPAPARTASAEDRFAQTEFGSRCSTLQGICSLPQPQPVGSVCFCSGDVRGTVIR